MADSENPRSTEGSLAFTELSSTDPTVTRRFLERAFGWRFRSIRMPQGEYLAYDAPGGRGGIRPVRPQEPPTSMAYIQVADLAAAQARIEAAGGKIVLPRVEIPEMGCFFWFQAPGGPLLACWQDPPVHSAEAKEKDR